MRGISEVEFEDAVVQMYSLSTSSRSSQAQQAGSLCTELFRQLIILVILLFTNARGLAFGFFVFVALLTGVVAAAFLRMVLEGHGDSASFWGNSDQSGTVNKLSQSWHPKWENW